MAAAPLALVQLTEFDATLGGSQANRAAFASSKLTLDRPKVQSPITQLLSAKTVPPGSFTSHQATGTFNSQPILLRSFQKLLGTVQISTVQKLFSSGTKCSPVVLGIIRLVGRRRQGSALTGS